MSDLRLASVIPTPNSKQNGSLKTIKQTPFSGCLCHASHAWATRGAGACPCSW
nr:hypothetical protein [uncultured Kingella sp.]